MDGGLRPLPVHLAQLIDRATTVLAQRGVRAASTAEGGAVEVPRLVKYQIATGAASGDTAEVVQDGFRPLFGPGWAGGDSS